MRYQKLAGSPQALYRGRSHTVSINLLLLKEFSVSLYLKLTEINNFSFRFKKMSKISVNFVL